MQTWLTKASIVPTVFGLSPSASFCLPKSDSRDICKQICQHSADTRFNGRLKMGVITASQN